MSYTQVDTTTTTTSTAIATSTSSTTAVRRRSSAINVVGLTPPSALLELELEPPPSEELEYSQFPSTSSSKITKRLSSTSTSEEFVSGSSDEFHDELPQEINVSSRSLKDYYRVMKQYPMYRAYFFSHVCQNMGDWFVRIASILVVEQLNSSGKTLGHLTLSVLLPKAIFAQVGGLISDKFDRRNSMIVLDIISGVVVLGYLLAIYYESLEMIYFVSAVRSSLGATYYPITTGIVPLLVDNVQDLQLAVTLNSWAWGFTSIIGGLVAGSITAAIGLSTCYIIDCVTFMLSALVMYFGVHGNFKVTNSTNHPGTPHTHLQGIIHQDLVGGRSSCNQNPIMKIYKVFQEVGSYLWICGFGLLVFSKPSASFVWGIEDIVGAEFSTVFDEDGIEDEELSSWHMGQLFSVIGSGCMAGPALVNYITDAQKPYTLQRACLIGLIFLTCGWFSISMVGDRFHWFLFCTFFRTMGSGTVWVNSTVLLQALSEKHILGRVLAVEYTLTTLTEAMSATTSGNLSDEPYNYTKNQLALFGACLGVSVVTFWSIYYFFQQGAAHPRFNYYKQASTAVLTTSKGRKGSLELTSPASKRPLEILEDIEDDDTDTEHSDEK